MDKLEKVEVIREKTGVSYDDANAALEACNGEILDAIIFLERLGKTAPKTAAYTTTSAETSFAGQPVSPEMMQAQTAYQESSKKSRFGEKLDSIFAYLKGIAKKSLETTFVAERNGERVMALPILFLIIGLFLWGATIWLLILGLFFNFRYHIEGISRVTVDINEVMDKAGEMADSIKKDVSDKNDANGDE